MIEEIEAKSILVKNKYPNQWFGVQYTMNIYKGCQHGCIYCDSRSECYRIENFDNILVKTNAVELLKNELARKRIKGTIGTGAMSDPYTHVERKYKFTRKALEVIADFRYPVNIVTKSNLILRDIDLLKEINKIYASVAITITTADDNLAKKIEPFASSPTERFEAIGILSELGINVGITMMPILPFIEDNEENIMEILNMAKKYGVKYIYPFFGVTLRDRQRDYYYEKLDKLFPGVKEKYQSHYKNYYSCRIEKYEKIKKMFYDYCKIHGISTEMPSYYKEISSTQLSFLE